MKQDITKEIKYLLDIEQGRPALTHLAGKLNRSESTIRNILNQATDPGPDVIANVLKLYKKAENEQCKNSNLKNNIREYRSC